MPFNLFWKNCFVCYVMLCCDVLCRAMLCCIVLCCVVSWCAVCSVVLCCAVLCCAVLCCAVLCCTVLCCTVLCCVVIWKSLMLFSRLLFRIVLCGVMNCTGLWANDSTQQRLTCRAQGLYCLEMAYLTSLEKPSYLSCFKPLFGIWECDQTSSFHLLSSIRLFRQINILDDIALCVFCFAVRFISFSR